MSTQRPDVSNIISSGNVNSTARHQSGIIPSVISSVAPAPVAHGPQAITSLLANEIILNGVKYKILKQIARSGEAEVFLVNANGTDLVFKYYYSQYKPKDEILVKLKGLRHPYIIALFDYGYHHDRFFEISEYAQGGTLHDHMPITTFQKTKEIVDQTIEGLNYCHTHGIIHRDIKPENIFYRTVYKREIALGDFGIASNLKEGEELVRTSMARTSLYAAPELFTNIQGKTTIEKSVDYYALGMSLLHMWFGRNPFEDVDEFGIMRLKSEGRVLFPDNIDDEVETLIKGLITVNPRDRWGYEEVKKWINGENVKVFYQTISFEYKPYAFGLIDGEQIVVNNPKDLVWYLEKYPDRGEGHLYRNSIAKWIETVDPGLFNDLMDIVEKDFPRDRTAGLTKATYILDPERPFRGFDNTKLRTQEEIAAHFERNFDHYKNDLSNPNAAFYIFLESRNYQQNADEYRNYFKTTNPEAALNALIFKLQGADKFIIGDYTIYQPEELLMVDAVTEQLIIDQLANVNSKLSLWINGFKKLAPTLVKWHALKRFDERTLRYALQEGFEFRGFVANDRQDVFQMLKNNIGAFFQEPDAEQNRNEANYWLQNYMDSSFGETVIDHLKTENCSDREFILMLNYAYAEHDAAGMNLYEVVETLLPSVKNKKSDNKKTGNKILLSNVIEIHLHNVVDYWAYQAKTSALLFLDCLIDFINFLERNMSSYPELFSPLVVQLNDHVSAGVRKDITLVSGDEPKTEDYRNDLSKAVDRLKRLQPDMPYVLRFQHELALLKKNHQDIKQGLVKEKKEKLNITNSKFDKILQRYRAKYRERTKDAFNETLYWNIAVGSVGIFFMIASFIYTEEGPITFVSLAAIILASFLGSRIGNNIGAMITKADDEKNLLGAVIGLYAGCLLGYHFSAMLPTVSGLEPFGVYAKVSSEVITVISVILLAIFGGRAFYLYRENEKALNAIGLEPQEQDALDQNLKEIDRYFKEKETFDVFQETVRILSLDDGQFDQEFAKSKIAA